LPFHCLTNSLRPSDFFLPVTAFDCAIYSMPYSDRVLTLFIFRFIIHKMFCTVTFCVIWNFLPLVYLSIDAKGHPYPTLPTYVTYHRRGRSKGGPRQLPGAPTYKGR
jgi:hypothetical protein